jgi:hypothetical protein
MPKSPDQPVERALKDVLGRPVPFSASQPPKFELAYDDPGGRALWFRRSRLGEDRHVLRNAIAKASAQKRLMERKRALSAPTPPGGPGSVNWAKLGPEKIDGGQGGAVHPVVSGRITSIAVGPGGTRGYVGSANGGVWLTEDAGATWSPLDEFANTPPSSGPISSTLEADSLAVGAVAVRFRSDRSSDVVFAGTGEPGGNADGYFGIGIKVSADGGATFSLEATNLASSEVYRIVIDPDDATTVFAATTSGLFQRPAAAPFTSWNFISSANFSNASGRATDIAVAGNAAGSNKVYYVGFEADKVYKSTDTGANWNAVGGLAAAGRITLATGESAPTVAYALVADGTLSRLDSGTAGNFQRVTGVPRALFAGSQGWYDAVVAVDPANASTVFLVGDLTLDGDWALSIYKGTITGGPGAFVFPFNSANDQAPGSPPDPNTTNNVPNDPTWVGRGVHPDGHALAFATKSDGTHDGSIVWVGSDGGVFTSTSGGAEIGIRQKIRESALRR